MATKQRKSANYLQTKVQAKKKKKQNKTKMLPSEPRAQFEVWDKCLKELEKSATT